MSASSLFKFFLVLFFFSSTTFAADYDSDGVDDEQDICPEFYDPNQEDSDQDGTGDACDTDGVQKIYTIAGNGTRLPPSSTPFSLRPATETSLPDLNSLTLSDSGELYISSSGLVLKLTSDGQISAIAGTYDGSWSMLVKEGIALDVDLNNVAESAYLDNGDLLFAETGASFIRRLTPSGYLTTVAGHYTFGSGVNTFGGDGGPAVDAGLAGPTGLVIDESGNIIFSDTLNNRIRKIDSTGVITTIAGSGGAGFFGDGGLATDAHLNEPSGLALDSEGALYISDTKNNRVRKVDLNGVITTVIGVDPINLDGRVISGGYLKSPTGLSFDNQGNLYIAAEHEHRIFKVSPDAIATTFAGTGVPGYEGDNDLPVNAKLSYPMDVDVDAQGNVYITERGNRVIRVITGIAIDQDGDFVAAHRDNCFGLSNPDQKDTDSDGLGNACDLDDDNDGLEDTTEDQLGTDPLLSDTDSDGLTDFEEFHLGSDPLVDGDLDTDAVKNSLDNCIYFYNPNQIDTDGDEIGDDCDIDGQDNLVTTIVGTGGNGFNGDGLIATETALNSPSSIVFDQYGNLYIADSQNARIRKVDQEGRVSTIAGSGVVGLDIETGDATDAPLYSPKGVSVDETGNVYFLDAYLVKKVSTAGIIETISGAGNNEPRVNGGLAKDVRLSALLTDTSIDHEGNLLIAAESTFEQDAVHKIDHKGLFFSIDVSVNPQGMDVDSDGNIYLSDYLGNCFEKINSSGVGTPYIANCADNVDDSLKPKSLIVDGYGNLLVSSGETQVVSLSPSLKSVIAGTGVAGFAGDGGLAIDAQFDGILDMTLGPEGDLYIADSKNHRIRKVSQRLGDVDADFIANFTDNCVFVANQDQSDSDGDGQGDACDVTPNGPDSDLDGVPDGLDNCPAIVNSNQEDTDSDGQGDLCDASPNGPDTDSDGVPDSLDNCPDLGNADQRDTDVDGQGDVCDATPNGPDMDLDGIIDSLDNCVTISNTDQLDTDNDGEGNVCDATPNGPDEDLDGVPDATDNCPSNSNASQFDLDLDGLGDECDSDSDGDSILDEWELNNGLDPRDPTDATSDFDGDGLTNLEEYQQGTNISVDDVAPVLTIPSDLIVNSTGPETAVDLGLATASDVKDGVIVPIVDNAGPFVPGRHIVTWSATDEAGNTTSATQTVDVIPQVSFSVSQVIDEGSSATVNISLNGSAVTYPVTIPYSVSGTAESGADHNLESGEVLIESGTSATLDVLSVEDVNWEGDENILVTMGIPANAVQGSITDHTITLREENIAPIVSVEIRQGGLLVTTVAADAGDVELTANIVDPNPDDEHSYDWSMTSNSLVTTSGYSSMTFVFDPSLLSAGIYGLAVTATDDGEGLLNGSAESLLSVIVETPVLADDVDSDGDGIADADEGVGDEDLDRIPDYLDPVDEPNQLPAAEGGSIVQTDPGLQLTLGETAFASSNASASVTMQDLVDHGGTGGGAGANVEDDDYQFNSGIFDFEVIGAETGESVRIVLPQLAAIPANAVYRKYFADTGWADFVGDANNSVASAPGSLGVCPAPGDASFVTGLSEGHFCVQLTIEDGGPNDTDQQANGVVKDPGGVAVQVIPMPNVGMSKISVGSSSFNGRDGEQVVLGFMLSSDSTDAEVRELTVSASGELNETSDISGVRLYRDDNKNGIPEGTERVAEGSYDVDDGDITFTLPDAYQLPVGDTHYLVTYQF